MYIQQIDTSDETCLEKYEEFINQNRKILHNNHWILTQCRVNIIDVFENFGKMNLEILRIVADQGSELVKLFDILRLGSLSLRGYILYYWRWVLFYFINIIFILLHLIYIIFIIFKLLYFISKKNVDFTLFFSVYRSNVLNYEYEAGKINELEFKDGRDTIYK